jgi:hypothetical protein
MTNDFEKMINGFEKMWWEAFGECDPFVRDTTLPPRFLEKYQVGLLLREPTFCDASYKIGGFIAPDRFLIFSSNARIFDKASPQAWGHCVWPTGRCFRIIDKITHQNKSQITLLEIPDEILRFFYQRELGKLEQYFVKQARKIFDENVNADPIPELNTEDWRQKVVSPIGINHQGDYFPLGDEVGPTGGTGKWFEIVGFSPIGPNDNVEITDAIRIGDVVYFERIAPEEIVLRVLILEKAGDYVGKKYRIERSDRPGALTLIELTY